MDLNEDGLRIIPEFNRVIENEYEETPDALRRSEPPDSKISLHQIRETFGPQSKIVLPKRAPKISTKGKITYPAKCR